MSITENGKLIKKWVVFTRNTIFIDLNHITLAHSGRGYMANTDATTIESNMFYAANLLGGSLSFDVNLSQSKCSCNSALYLVSMPGYNSQGQPDPSTSKDYYCDANIINGNKCPEIDIMEANQYAFSKGVHRCNNPINKHYDTCENGCGRRIYH